MWLWPLGGWSEAAGQELAPDHRRLEVGALFFSKNDYLDRVSGLDTLAAQPAERFEGSDDAEGTVEATSIFDRVEVRAGEDRRRHRFSTFPPDAEVANAVQTGRKTETLYFPNDVSTGPRVTGRV